MDMDEWVLPEPSGKEWLIEEGNHSNEWENGEVELSLGGVTEYSSDNTDAEALPAYYLETEEIWVGFGPIPCHCSKSLYFSTTVH